MIVNRKMKPRLEMKAAAIITSAIQGNYLINIYFIRRKENLMSPNFIFKQLIIFFRVICFELYL